VDGIKQKIFLCEFSLVFICFLVVGIQDLVGYPTDKLRISCSQGNTRGKRAGREGERKEGQEGAGEEGGKEGGRKGGREEGREVKHSVKLYTSAAHLHIRSTTHMNTIPRHGLPIQPGNVGQSLLPDAPLGRVGEKG